jgi:hypothetical protein
MRCASAASASTSRRLQRRDGAPEGGGARQLGRLGRGGHGDGLVRLREKLGATEFLGYSTESAEGGHRRAGARRRRGRDGVGRRERFRSWSTRRRSTENRADRSAMPATCAARVFGHRGQRHAEEGRGPVRACRQGRVGHGAPRCRRRARGRPRAPPPDPLQPLRDAPFARGAARGAGHACRAEGLDGGARAAALRLLASGSRFPTRTCRASKASPIPSCCRTRRSARG